MQSSTSPTQVDFGPGSASRIADALGEGERVLVCTTAGGRARFPALFSSLAARCEATVEAEDMHASSLESVESLLARHRGGGATRIVAVGGGSVLDTAKALAIGLGADVPFSDVLDDPDSFASQTLPLVAVPTTAGTGSEVTRWGTVWDTAAGRKRSIVHAALYPERAFVDPELSGTQPPRLTAVTGCDALSHSLEAIWNRNATDESTALAEEAIGLVAGSLETAVNAPTTQARADLARAATLAGFAISATRTAAAHSVSYPLTLRHDVDHGQACSITLPWLLEWTGASHSVQPILRGLGVPDAAAGAERLRALFAACGLPVTLSGLGLSASDLPAIVAASCTPSRMNNALRPLEAADVTRMLEELL